MSARVRERRFRRTIRTPFAFDGRIEKVTIDLIDDRQSAEVKAAIAKEQANANMKRKLSD